MYRQIQLIFIPFNVVVMLKIKHIARYNCVISFLFVPHANTPDNHIPCHPSSSLRTLKNKGSTHKSLISRSPTPGEWCWINKIAPPLFSTLYFRATSSHSWSVFFSIHCERTLGMEFQNLKSHAIFYSLPPSSIKPIVSLAFNCGN